MEKNPYSETMLKKQQLEENQVIVRIWTSQVNINHPGKNVGHISIQTPNIYLSLWPTRAGKNNGLGVLNSIESDNNLDFKADKKAEEGRDPELVFCFYTLDIDKISQKFKEIYDENNEITIKKWSLTGLAFLGDGDSCASAAWKLLLAGELGKLVSAFDQSSESSKGSSKGSFISTFLPFKSIYHSLRSNREHSRTATSEATKGSIYATEMSVSFQIKSPDFIGNILKVAKNNEIKNNPLVAEIIYDQETPILEQVNNRRWCNIL